jgi:hypothetical protein
MESDIDTVKITMTYTEAERLKEDMKAMIEDIGKSDEALGGYFDEPRLREVYPTVNNLLSAIVLREELPF